MIKLTWCSAKLGHGPYLQQECTGQRFKLLRDFKEELVLVCYMEGGGDGGGGYNVSPAPTPPSGHTVFYIRDTTLTVSLLCISC